MMAQKQQHRSLMSKVGKIVFPILFLTVGVAAAAYFQASKPGVKKIRPKPAVLAVETTRAKRGSANVVVSCMGEAVPAQEINLEAEVSGTVISMNDNFIPGGVIPAGEEIIRLDDRDYRIQLKKAQSAVVNAKANFDIESGEQSVAREELEIIKKLSVKSLEANEDLVLRKPYLAQVEAALDSAKADLDQARIDLSRTVLRAPFDCLVTARSANLGTYVSSQDAVGTLVGSDEYWIEAAVPLDRLALLDLNQKGGAPTRVVSQTGDGEWSGRAVRLTGALTDQTRMAKVLVVVKDPLGLGRTDNASYTPLILGDYVQALIQGKQLQDVLALPRKALRAGDTVWTVEDGRLAIRPVKTAWKDDEHAFIASGVSPEDQIVVSDISTPVAGMQLSVLNADSNGNSGAQQQ
jgi:RND family efflux transporter MFP subunit